MVEWIESKLRDISSCKLIIAFGGNFAANIAYNFIFEQNNFSPWIK
jgi:hypothetical protein